MLTFDLDDFGTALQHRKGMCCPKCYECAVHFDSFCQALNHLAANGHHNVEFHIHKPEAIHSCGCAQCRKWIEINT